MNDVWEDAPDTVDDGDTVLNGQLLRDPVIDDEATVLRRGISRAPSVDDTILNDPDDETILNDADDDTVIGDAEEHTILNAAHDDTILSQGPRLDDNDDTVLGGERPNVGEQDDDTILNSRANTAAPSPDHDELPPLPPLPPMPTAASRPAPQFFASLALPDGRIIPVEGIVLIGRKPRSERIVSGVLPTLVQVPSPQGVVSSTHLEVRHEGSAVLVTDVGSSNGTALIIQGQPPRRLRAGEPTVVIPGTLLDLGDGVVLRVQPFERGELR